MELLTWVSSAEALRAAVAAGADAVRVGLRDCSLTGLEPEALKKAAAWCRVRGVRLSVGMDAPLSGSRFRAALDAAQDLARAGVSSFCVGDPGFLRALGLLLPELRLEAAEGFAVSDAGGARLLEALGAKSLLLPSQLRLEELRKLSGRTKLPMEAVLCGRVCPALGPCRFSAFAGEGPGCGRECREKYLSQGQGTELRPALKCVLLSGGPDDWAVPGVRTLSLRCEGQSPECAAMTTDIFRRALAEGKPPSERDLRLLLKNCFPEGGSEALRRGAPREALLSPQGERHWPNLSRSALLRPEYAGGEYQRVPVRFRAEVKRGSFSRIVAADREGHSAGATGPIPGKAEGGKREVTAAFLRTQLFNTQGTPFRCEGTEVDLEPGLSLSVADVGQMRREALARLSDRRAEPPPLRLGELPPLLRAEARREKPDITVSVRKTAQLSEALAALKPKVLYLPLAELLREPAAVTPFWENGTTSVCAVLPRRYGGEEAKELFVSLQKLKELQVQEVMAENWNSILPIRMLGFRLRCGLGLQVWNDWSLRLLRELEAASVMLSPELRLPEIGEISKCTDTELFAYGRLPLLTSEASLSAPGDPGDTLRDRRGRQFPVAEEQGRSVIYSPDKLFLGDRLRDLEKLGLWCLHLSFTTENAGECVSVAERYLGMGSYLPNFRTRGLYYENETHSGFRFSQKKGAAGNAGQL